MFSVPRATTLTSKIVCATVTRLCLSSHSHILYSVTREHLGQVGEVTITKDDTLLLQPGGSKDAIDARVEEIKQTVADTKSDYEKEKLNVCIVYST